MKLLLLTSLLLPGCAMMTFQTTSHSTPASPTPSMGSPYPTEVLYEVLGWATGEACSDSSSFTMPVMMEDGAAGPPDLYQKAKYKALESMPEADNLMYIRTAVTDDEEKTCVKVTGRGYRVASIASRPAVMPGADTAPARASTVNKSALPGSVDE